MDVAKFAGRQLRAFRGGLVTSLPFDTQASLDLVDTEARGRHTENKLAGRAFGVALKHAFVDVFRDPDTTFALGLEYRVAQAKATTLDSSVTPVLAHTYAAHLDGTSWIFKERLAVHVHGTLARLTLGTDDAQLGSWTAGGIVGGDLVLWQGFSLRGDAGFYRSYGDAKTKAIPITAGIHFGPMAGFFADLAGTLWPHGVELVDGALADLTVFRLDPIVASQPALTDLKTRVVGLFTMQLGYRASF